MTPEVIARVDAWLAERGATSGIVWWLSTEWRRASDRWESFREGLVSRSAVEAALTGILLALVREVWGSGCYVAPEIGGGWRLCGASLRGQSVQMQPCATEVECLVIALMNSTAAMEPQ